MAQLSCRVNIANLDFATDNADLGAVLNGFSLNESGPLAAALEKTGQAIDATYIATTHLVSISRLSSIPMLHFLIRTGPRYGTELGGANA